MNLHQLHDIHEKVLSFARQLVPINQARLVSLFASGSGWTRCIARGLAYCLLVPASTTPNVCFFFPLTSNTTTRTSLRTGRLHLNRLYYCFPLMLDPASSSTLPMNPRIMRSLAITSISSLWLSLILRRTLKKSLLSRSPRAALRCKGVPTSLRNHQCRL